MRRSRYEEHRDITKNIVAKLRHIGHTGQRLSYDDRKKLLTYGWTDERIDNEIRFGKDHRREMLHNPYEESDDVHDNPRHDPFDDADQYSSEVETTRFDLSEYEPTYSYEYISSLSNGPISVSTVIRRALDLYKKQKRPQDEVVEALMLVLNLPNQWVEVGPYGDGKKVIVGKDGLHKRYGKMISVWDNVD